MFSAVSACCESKNPALVQGSRALDVVSIVACSVIFALAMSGVVAMSPAAAYPLLGVASLQLVVGIGVICAANSGSHATTSRTQEPVLSNTKLYTISEVYKHNTEKDCWIAIDDSVYNVTKFIDQHPGGEEVLLDQAGKNGTDEFGDAAHSDEAIDMLKEYFIGKLVVVGNAYEIEGKEIVVTAEMVNRPLD